MELRVPFHALDDHPLAGRLFFPEDRDQAPGVVLMNPATAVPQGFYTRFARYLAERYRFIVFTYDYRGVGESRGDTVRGLHADMRDWGEQDFAGAVAWLKARYPSRPLLSVGHSFGGHTLAMSDAAHQLDGALTFGTQLGWIGHWPLHQRLRVGLTLRAFPLLTRLYGYLPGWMGLREDLPAGVARQWSRWCLQRNYFLDDHPEYGDRLSKLRCPVRIYGATDDDFAPAPGVQAYARHIPGAEARILSPAELGRPIGHLAPFRPQLSTPLWDEFGGLLAQWAA